MVSRIQAAIRAVLRLPEPVEIPANVVRIMRIPFDVLDYGTPVRDDLLALAWAGCDVDAYQPMGSDAWVIWCKPEYPDQNGRHSIEEWKAISAREYYRLLPDRAHQSL